MLTRNEPKTSPRADGGPPPPAPKPVRWSFIGDSSLPSHPEARGHEKRGRRWLVVSFLFCPCHVPLALALAGVLFGGSVLGAAVTGNALRLGIVMTVVYALLLWRGFRLIRRAKRIEAAGGNITCSSDGCEVVTAER